MATPAFKQKATDLGATADYMNPRQLGDFSAAELARWAVVVKTSKIEADYSVVGNLDDKNASETRME